MSRQALDQGRQQGDPRAERLCRLVRDLRPQRLLWDRGHCEIAERPAEPFDVPANHPLKPATIALDALARLETNEVVVTIVPVVPHEENRNGSDVLTIERVRLLTYIE